jgi:hypothetical protein
MLMSACSQGQSGKTDERNTSGPSTDMNYWYQGKAELSSYELKQSRYGQVHEGHAVMIFVTEDFNLEKQVKADRPSAVPSTKVMKLNFTKKFTTGIYPYSLMSSVFTPIDRSANSKSLKVSTSSQDWCGHSFMQLNLRDGNYLINQFSYFESEGDVQKNINADYLEDEIWNIIRLNPADLPLGKVNILPSTQYIRLRHSGNEAQTATAALKENNGISTYTLTYPDRELSIRFEDKSPFKILGWTETYRLSDGETSENLITTATLKKQIMLDYWNKHNVQDSVYRKQLGLE